MSIWSWPGLKQVRQSAFLNTRLRIGYGQFWGCFDSRSIAEEFLAKSKIVTYDSDGVVDINIETFQAVHLFGFSWQVQDLPENMARGRALALEREADRLSFADTWSEASGADLILVSGALHYLREPLARMLAKLNEPPEFILINRTPITDGAPFATIQDGGPFRVACIVHNRHSLLQELERVGYWLEDSWQATELSLRTPADPKHTVLFYSGLLLRRAKTLRA